MSGLSVELNSFLGSPQFTITEDSLYEKFEEHIQNEQYQEAVVFLLFSLEHAELALDKDVLYYFIGQLLPHFLKNEEKDQFLSLYERLPRLLEFAPRDAKNQFSLALSLGNHAFHTATHETEANKHPLLLEAMNYYASASRMETARLSPVFRKDCHRYFNQVFTHFLKGLLIEGDTFKSQLQEAYRKNDASAMQGLLHQTKLLKRFCITQEEKDNTVNKLRHFAMEVGTKKTGRFSQLFSEFFKEVTRKDPLPEKTQSEHYREYLTVFREGYELLSEQTLAQVQLECTKRFIQLFRFMADGALALLGAPPCTFDIRAMGSVGRGEICPYSDLEFFILIEEDNENSRLYFKRFSQILDLQVASLGESPDVHPFDFPCLGSEKYKGFYIDHTPSKEPALIQTPTSLPKFQCKDIDDSQSLSHSSLRSLSLFTTDPNLIDQYRKEAEKDTEWTMGLKKRASAQIETRKKKFKKIWPIGNPCQEEAQDLKEKYITPLIHLIGDLGLLFLGTQVENTTKIIKGLEEKRIFNNQSATLLHEALDFLYRLRIELHQYYKGQKDLFTSTPNQGGSLFFVQGKRKKELEKIYWLLLFPLYCSPNLEEDSEFDLLEQAFTLGLSHPQLCSDPKKLIPLVFQIANYYQQIDEPEETHIRLYTSLSGSVKNEPLRAAYLDTLKDSKLRKKLALIPNRDGMRQAYRLSQEALNRSLLEITTDQKPEEGQVVLVKKIGWDTQRYLHPEVANEILDTNNEIVKTYRSLHPVTPIAWRGQTLHFKMLPSQPMMEVALHNLFFRLAGDLSPASELVCFEISEGEKSYPVLISQTVVGTPLSELLKEGSPPPRIEPNRLTNLALASVLVKVGDGRSSNYVVEGKTISSVDNDVALVEPLTRNKLFFTKVHFASVLFLLYGDQVLDRKALEEFKKWNIDLLLSSWMEYVVHKEKEYLALFPKEQRCDLYDIRKGQHFTPTILFAKGALVSLRLQFQILQDKIRQVCEEDEELILLDLLKLIITLRDDYALESPVGNKIYREYEKASKRKESVEMQLASLRSEKKAQSLTLAQFQKVSLGRIPSVEEVENRNFSPEDALEELYAVIVRVNDQLTHTKDALKGSFEGLQKEGVADMDRQNLVLRALHYQFEKAPQKPPHLFFPNCSVLSVSKLLPFLHKELRKLDLSHCQSMESKVFNKLEILCPNLEELLISGSEIVYCGTQFFENPLTFPSLTHLHVTNEKNLRSLTINAPKLTQLTLTHNPTLKKVELKVGSFPVIQLEGSHQVDLIVHNLQGSCKTKEALKRAQDCYLALCSPPFSEKPPLAKIELLHNLGWITQQLEQDVDAEVHYRTALTCAEEHSLFYREETLSTLKNLIYLANKNNQEPERDQWQYQYDQVVKQLTPSDSSLIG